MMPAVKAMDPVMGVDIHIVLIPTPAGPVPTPLPHPFVGMMFDPMDFLPFVGATVKVNAMPRCIAGSCGKAIPPHIPMGGPFQMPPSSECEAFMGSATVLMDGDAATFTALPVLSCSDVGMIPPIRTNPKKKKKMTGMVTPTSVVMGIPMGMFVNIGGPPTITMSFLMGKAMEKGIGAAIGAGMKKLKKLQKGSKRMKKISDKIHKKADDIMDKLKVSKSKRNKIHKKICSITGHPVDIATGKVFTDNIDFELSGAIPFQWERSWFSTSKYSGPLGHGWSHNYDIEMVEEGGAVAIRMSDGRPVAFPSLKEEQMSFDRSEKMWFFRDKRGYGYRTKDGLAHRFEPIPDCSKRKITSIEDRSGNYIKFSYTPSGNLLQITDSHGRDIYFDHDINDRISAIHMNDPDKPGEHFTRMRYEYNDYNDMIKAIDANDNAWTFEYVNHLLVKETDRNGLCFQFEYDQMNSDGKCLRTWGTNGIYDHKLTYKEDEKITLVENSLGHVTTHHIADSGLVTKVVDANGNESSIEYNEFNEPLVETDELGRQTLHTYDEFGNEIETTFPDSTSVAIEYNDNYLPVKAIDVKGGEWIWEYDEASQLIKKTDPQGKITEFTYEKGLLKEFKDPSGAITKINYDNNRRIAQMVTPDEGITGWEYDSQGRVRAIIDPKGNRQGRLFDIMDRVVQLQEPDGNIRTLSYDSEGNLLKAKDAQYDVDFEYSGMGKMVARIQNDTRVEFVYNTEEKLTGIKNEAGFVYSFELDKNGDVAVESGFDEIKRVYTRDALGRVASVERASGTISNYEYDDADRVIKISHSTGESEEYTYRIDGELERADNDEFMIKYERDEMGRVLKEYQGQNWVESIYNDLGMRIEMSSSMGAVQKIERTIMGDVTSVLYKDSNKGEDPLWQAQFGRDLMGLEISRSLPGGLSTRWKRDRLGRPVQHSITTEKGFIRTRDYSWDVNNRLTKIADSLAGTTSYIHDEFGNLASAILPDGSEMLRMPDAVGNLFKSRERTDRVYGAAGELKEQHTRKGVIYYEYDAEGNLIKKTMEDGSVWQYSWNASGMMSSVLRPDGSDVQFKYDALGRRVQKIFRGRITNWVWDGNFMLHEWNSFTQEYRKEEREINKALKEREIAAEQRDIVLSEIYGNAPPLPQKDEEVTTWLFEPDSFAPMAKIKGDKRYSIITDHLGTPLAMFDEAGAKTWFADTDIYGGLINVAGNRSDCPFRFPGQYEDEETGLYYNRFRYYDAEMGGYISQDPIGLDGDNPTQYAYVHDLLQAIDPLGLLESVTFPASQVIAETTIQMQGGRGRDFKAANANVGLNGQRGRPTQNAHRDIHGDVTWHHASYDPATNTAKMQLVSTPDHQARLPHKGSVKDFEDFTGTTYETSAAKSRAKQLNAGCGG